jgi:hypothetical protein
MSYAPSLYTGDGSTTNFAVPFSYLAPTDVYVFVGGVSVAFTFLTSNFIQLAVAPAAAAPIQILRQTANDTRKVVYADGVALTANLLNSADDQLFFMAQEAFVTANASTAINAATAAVTAANADVSLTHADVVLTHADVVLATAQAVLASGYAGGMTAVPVQINAATAGAIVDADYMGFRQNSAGVFIKITWANIKATLKTYFDTVYAAAAHTHTFSSLTARPTTVGGYGITDAAPLGSPALTGVPTAPSASAGTNTTQIATTAMVQLAVAAGSSGLGVSQAWQDVHSSRAINTSYQNTTGKPIGVSVAYRGSLQSSGDNITWVSVSQDTGSTTNNFAIIPPNHYYRLNGGSTSTWVELR